MPNSEIVDFQEVIESLELLIDDASVTGDFQSLQNTLDQIKAAAYMRERAYQNRLKGNIGAACIEEGMAEEWLSYAYLMAGCPLR